MANFERATASSAAQLGRTGVGLRLALAGGGTGGHILPGLHLLEQAEPGELADVLWFQTGRAVEETTMAAHPPRVDAPFERHVLRLEPRQGGAPSLYQLSVLTAPATLQARRALSRHGCDVVLGLGGFTSLPVVLAARAQSIPVVLLEINATMGKATRWLAPLSRAVAHAWRGTYEQRLAQRGARAALDQDVLTGPPLSPAFQAPPTSVAQQRIARQALGFDAERPLLLVLGGSQGAVALNRFVTDHAETFAAEGVQVLHQTGVGKLERVARSDRGYRAVEFVHDVPLALRAATVVLCRGGASTLAEVAALSRPAWVVPYPHHPDRHQEANARMLGAGVRSLPEAQLDGARALELARLAGASGATAREAMSAALVGCVPRDGARRLLDLLQRVAHKRIPPQPRERAGAAPRVAAQPA